MENEKFTSPYHSYMRHYNQVRSVWRQQLWRWIRRPSAPANASISPATCLAGNYETLTLTVTLTERALERGGRLAIFFPTEIGGYRNRFSPMTFQGTDGKLGYGSRIRAVDPTGGKAKLKTLVYSNGTCFTAAEVVVEEGRIAAGERVDILIGDPDCKPPLVSEKAKTHVFRVAIDYGGNDGFRPVLPNPEVRVLGNRPVSLRCFAPATPVPGKPFAVKIVTGDAENHNPSHHYCGIVKLSDAQAALAGPEEIVFEPKFHGIATVKGVVLHSDAPNSLRVIDEANCLIGRSNPILPAGGPEGLSLYYGEIHSHTDLSDGAGTPEDNLRWARDVEGLDFAAISDHFEEHTNYNFPLAEKWRLSRAATEAFYQPGKFVTLLGYEIGTLEKHRNVYFSDAEGRMIVEEAGGARVTMDNVYAKLDGTDYILIPHAPKFHGIDWQTRHNPEHQRLVEICSLWGISEEGGPLSVQHALNLGYKFGFTGGSDNHSAEPGNPAHGGLTGLYAPELTRTEVFKALMSRRTFATTGHRIIMIFTVNGVLMGGETTGTTATARRIAVRVLAPEAIASLEIIRNGKVAFAQKFAPDCTDAQVGWLDESPLTEHVPEREITPERFAYYYARVTTCNGIRGWASPVWVALSDSQLQP